MAVTQEVLDKLAEFDSPTICNVIELFEVRPRNTGYMDGRIKSNFPDFKPMVGYASTACFRSDAPPAGGDAYGSLQAQLAQFEELPGPAVVVFEDIDDPPVSAVFGEVMCSTYQAYGSAGWFDEADGEDRMGINQGISAYVTAMRNVMGEELVACATAACKKAQMLHLKWSFITARYEVVMKFINYEVERASFITCFITCFITHVMKRFATLCKYPT